MTKKLFVVLVLVSVMILSFSLLYAAKAPHKGPLDVYTKATLANQKSASDLPQARIETKKQMVTLPQGVGGAGQTVPHLAPAGATCHLQYYDPDAIAFIFYWYPGDENAHYFDPAALCTDCPIVYPYKITQVSGLFYDFATVGSVGVIVHIYDAGNKCDGPGTELYAETTTVTTFYPDEAVIPLTTPVCVDGPFFVSIEYNGGTNGSIPCVLMTDEPFDTCMGWLFYDGYSPPWYEWSDFWTEPTGYLALSVDGQCNAEACLGTACDMVEGTGTVRSYMGWLEAGYGFAVYYDPNEYCTAPVFPYKINKVWFPLYDFAGAGTVDLQVFIYLQCEEICNGPGSPLYESPVFSATTFYPSVMVYELPEVVCAFEPFFVAVKYASGDAGSTPSLMLDRTVYEGGLVDTCHAWGWDKDYSPPWYDWYDFWTLPTPGYPMIYVDGFTASTACEFEPCDSALTTIPGGLFTYYVWRNPSRYGDTYQAERFTMPDDRGGRLDKIQVMFSATQVTGTPDPQFYVWLSDGVYPLENNPPYQALATFQVNFADIVYSPAFTEVATHSMNVQFDPSELFHIGFGHAYDAGDTLRLLSDDASANSTRSTEWTASGAWGDMLTDWGVGVDFRINALICPGPSIAPSFSLKCTPALAYGTPGDPPADRYTVEVKSLVGYALPVTLSLLSVTPLQPITATFTPNGLASPYTSTVAIQVPVGVPYGDYTLTFQGVGGDAQTKVCDVTLTVQPPYDEGIVNFYHGYQWVTNFGAVANDAEISFYWYGAGYLFDGSIISAVNGTPQADHFALDAYDCSHVGFIPTGHLEITHQPFCAGGGVYEENYGEVAYANFYTSEDVISCEYDSLFVIGLSDVQSTDFSIKIKIYYNPTVTPIPELFVALYEDWDIGDAYNNSGAIDPVHNLVYQFDPLDPNLVFGIMRVPVDDAPMHSINVVRNPQYVWPNAGFCTSWGLDSLWYLMTQPGYFAPVVPDTDLSIMVVPPPFALNPGDKHIEMWIDFGRNLGDGLSWQQWYHKILRYAGFYRGDVNASDQLELPALDVSDLVYLSNYLYQGGPAPLPFIDQANVDGKGPYGGPIDTVCPKNNVDVQDIVYLLNYVFKDGPPPIDYVRFIEQYWSRPSLFTNPNWQ